MSLAPGDHPTVTGLLRSNVEQTTAGLKVFFKSHRWIGKTNRYAENAVARLQKDYPLTILKKRNLSQYIAASAILHASDGWSYLGRAFTCLMNGDPHRALHLSYYAELRAGMSLLAGGGLGVFKNWHYAITGVNTTSRLSRRSPTHEFAWSALEFWSQLPTSGDLFADVVRPEGRTLDEWFHPHGGAKALAAQARDWFMQWGMDLRFASDDRMARNESSYRPDGIPQSWCMAPPSSYEFVRDAWRLLEPGNPSRFEEIDRHILRLAIERQFRSVTGQEPDATKAPFQKFVEKTVEAQALPPLAEKRWRDFFLRKSLPNDPEIFRISATKPTGTSADCLAVAARAILLLRLATGSAHDLLRQAGLKQDELTFWWKALGEARGMWDPATPPAALTDLWADIQDALAEIDAAIGPPTSLTSMKALADALEGYRGLLSSHERVGLWATCPG